MNRKRTIPILATLTSALVVAAAAAASAPSHASIVIRHQVRGCHSWSVNGGPFKASQAITRSRGSSITITNNDLMPHKLVETSGPALTASGLRMRHMAATAKVRFTHAGVYRFTTKPGEDYMQGVKTIGEDNVLRLTVKVA